MLGIKSKKKTPNLGRVVDHLEEIGLLLHNGGREEYGWNRTGPHGPVLVLPCLAVTVNRLVG